MLFLLVGSSESGAGWVRENGSGSTILFFPGVLAHSRFSFFNSLLELRLSPRDVLIRIGLPARRKQIMDWKLHQSDNRLTSGLPFVR